MVSPFLLGTAYLVKMKLWGAERLKTLHGIRVTPDDLADL
jgi:hypothetical protein